MGRRDEEGWRGMEWNRGQWFAVPFCTYLHRTFSPIVAALKMLAMDSFALVERKIKARGMRHRPLSTYLSVTRRHCARGI